MNLSFLRRGVETFDVSEPTSPVKSNKSNTQKAENSNSLGENGNTNGEMYDAHSQNTESPNYDDFVDFDPSNFRLTPQSTISPKREEGLLTEFKSVESISSAPLLSVEYSEHEEDAFYNDQEEELAVDNLKDGNLEVLVEDLNKEGAGQKCVDVELAKEGDGSEEVEMLNVSLTEQDVESLDLNFDISLPLDKYREGASVEVDSDAPQKGSKSKKEKKPLDTGRLFNYLKSEKLNEVCRRLQEDLKGTKKHKFEEFALTGELPFSERVYNYIEYLNAYSTVSSQDPTSSSRLSSIDLKTLHSAETVETIDTEEREKDFEQALESLINQPDEHGGSKNLYKELAARQKPEVEVNAEKSKEVEEICVEDTSESSKGKEEEELGAMDEDLTFDLSLKTKQLVLESESTREEYVDKKTEESEELVEMDEDLTFDLNIKSKQDVLETEFATSKEEEEVCVEDTGDSSRSRELEDNKMDEDVNEEEDLKSEVKEEFLKRFKNMEQKKVEEVEVGKEVDLEEEIGEKSGHLMEVEEDKWYGLECMASSLGVKVVNACLKSVKIEVGENLDKYDVYKGTKLLLNQFLEIVTRLNQLEEKLKQNFMDLEKNNKGVEATRSSYVFLGKTKNRLEGLLEYHKEYEKLQRESIKLKSENIALMRAQILETLNKFRKASNVSETVEKMLTLEDNLRENYNKTGFFMVPLKHEGTYNFMYLINYNYYTKLKGTNTNMVLKDYGSNDSWPTKEMLEKLKAVELLPYQPHTMKPDMELKMFLYFQSELSSSSSASNYYMSPHPPSSSSNLPSLDVFQPKMSQKTTKVKECKLVEGEGSHGVNLEIDLNMYIEPYSLKNDLNMVFYAPLHTDSPYYRFKYDLIQHFNSLMYERVKNYYQELTENIQLFELLETVVQLASELNTRFQHHLKQFHDLLSLSTNHCYLKTRTSFENFGNQSHWGNSPLYLSNGFKGNPTESKWSYNSNNPEFNSYSELNSSHMVVSDSSKAPKDPGKERVLKLMLTFKNNMPCLWCNVYFDFDNKSNKTKFLGHYYKEHCDGIVNRVQFEFVHKLNASYLASFQDKLAQLNEAVNGPKKSPNLVDHIASALASHQFHL